jgi:hypothetical protein
MVPRNKQEEADGTPLAVPMIFQSFESYHTTTCT